MTWRKIILGVLLAVSLVVLAVEVWAAASAFTGHSSSDYQLYVRRGQEARVGVFFSMDPPNPYPLPTTLLIFVPLSFLPDWFVVIWSLGPYLLLLILFGRTGLLWWFYYPMLIQGGTGQMDGWLILPLFALLKNYKYVAGISAVILLFKPQLAWLPVLIALVLWLWRRDLPNLIGLFGTFVLLWGPTFLIEPGWIMEMVAPMLARANESITPTRGASIMGWATWYGGWLIWFIPLLLLLAGFLAYRVLRAKPIETGLCLDLFLTPVLYASNMVMLISLFRDVRSILIIIVASWIGVALDGLFNVFGGAYVILPLTAMWLLSNPKSLDRLKLPIPIQGIGRSNKDKAANSHRQ